MATTADRTGRPRRRARTAGVLGLLGLATALAMTAASAIPAFAVTSNPDGTVTVTISDLVGVSGANTALANLGVRAEAVPMSADCADQTTGLEPAPSTAMATRSMSPDGVIITPDLIPSGDLLVLGAYQYPTSSGQTQDEIAVVGLVSGTAPTCLKQGFSRVLGGYQPSGELPGQNGVPVFPSTAATVH